MKSLFFEITLFYTLRYSSMDLKPICAPKFQNQDHLANSSLLKPIYPKFQPKLAKFYTYDDPYNIENHFSFDLRTNNTHHFSCKICKIWKLLFMICPPSQRTKRNFKHQNPFQNEQFNFEEIQCNFFKRSHGSN